MNAYILKSGLAIRETGISSIETSVEGFVSSFVYINNQKKFYYYTTDEKNNLDSGYYDDIEISNYISRDMKGMNKDSPKPTKFSNFEYAQTSDTITIEIVNISSNDFYKSNKYTFDHLVGRSYLLSNGKLDVSFMGTPVSNSNFNYDPVIKNIFSKHIALLSQVTYKKDEYIKYTIYSALRANQILEELFPVFLQNPNNISLNNLAVLINEIKNSWGSTNINYSNISAAGSESYYQVLTSFYVNSKNYISYIRISEETERINTLIALLQPLSDFGISVDTKISILKNLCLKKKLTETDKNTINSIAMSFSSNQQTLIDDFLEKLVAKNNYFSFQEEYSLNFVTHSHKRNTITLFEAIFKKLDDDTEKKLWVYSPIYKEIHSKFPIDEKATTLHIFIMSIYALWIKSKYNPYRNNTFHDEVIGFSEIPTDTNKIFKYTRRTATSFIVDNQTNTTSNQIDYNASPLTINVSEYFIATAALYFDTINTRFSFVDKIMVESSDYKQFQFSGGWMSPAQYEYMRQFYVYGYYHLYQPIQIINISDDKVDIPIHSWDINGISESNTLIPAFLYHFMTTSKHEEILYSLAWLPVQAAWNVAKETIRPIKIIGNVIDKLLNVSEELSDITHPKSAREFIHDYALTHI